MTTTNPLRIKLIARGNDATAWSRQLPASGSFTGDCRFLFSMAETKYDFLVVIDDVSRRMGAPAEALGCADEHTLLVTTEPPTITHYGAAFCAQFAQVLTSQPAEALRHPERIYSHTGNLWFNGHSFTKLKSQPIPKKTRALSVVCSSKQQIHTLHNERYRFCGWLAERLPDMDLYGHGSRFIEHKYVALDPYRLHLAIENYSGPHHWTEKLADPFLSGCFPIYHGCTNLGDYFPRDSFLEIDIHKRGEALAKIRGLIEDDGPHPEREEALREAQRRVMHEYNMLHMIEHLTLERYRTGARPSRCRLYNRKQMRYRYPIDALDFAKWHLNRYI